ncbi:MAG: fumarylacetoacetate hydrolase family protein [Caldisericaceae bacterium]|nr:fumarylacetoacetate hydrolase family protein [Caldisericaceae bacterium]
MNKVRLINDNHYSPSKIVAVGLNYSEHIAEMQSKRADEPVIFMKPNSALCRIYEPIAIPTEYGSVHHEIELAVLIGKAGFEIAESEAMHHVAGYGIALDLTLRDMQKKAKERGHPWAIAKGFKNACPVSDFFPAEQIENAHNLDLKLIVNGKLRQKGNTRQMLFKIPELIAYISKFFPLEEGDILLTGTPSGVGPLKSGDVVEAEIESLANVQTKIVSLNHGK